MRVNDFTGHLGMDLTIVQYRPDSQEPRKIYSGTLLAVERDGAVVLTIQDANDASKFERCYLYTDYVHLVFPKKTEPQATVPDQDMLIANLFRTAHSLGVANSNDCAGTGVCVSYNNQTVHARDVQSSAFFRKRVTDAGFNPDVWVHASRMSDIDLVKFKGLKFFIAEFREGKDDSCVHRHGELIGARTSTSTGNTCLDMKSFTWTLGHNRVHLIFPQPLHQTDTTESLIDMYTDTVVGVTQREDASFTAFNFVAFNTRSGKVYAEGILTADTHETAALKNTVMADLLDPKLNKDHSKVLKALRNGSLEITIK